MYMRAATLQEMELMNEAIFPHTDTKGWDKVVSKVPSERLSDEKAKRTYLFKNVNGYVYASSQDVPRDTSDTILDASLRSVHFSGAQRRLMKHFEPFVQWCDEALGDLFPDTIPPISET
jgi:aspartyl/asparaginyl beta-hydroxylase (cupin superfamily)